jgi:hypothetical protein
VYSELVVFGVLDFGNFGSFGNPEKFWQFRKKGCAG